MNELEIKQPKLTLKESLFLKLYVDPKSKTFGNQTLSALEVWKDQAPMSAAVTANRTLKKANIKLTDLMDRKGLSEGKLLSKFSEWLDAKKIKTSLTEPDVLTDDYQTQLKAGEMIMKIKGIGADNGNTTNIQVNTIIGEKRSEYDI